MHSNKTSDLGTVSGAAALPCLNSDISTEIQKVNRLSTQHRRSAFVLKESVQKLSERFGLERLGFLTLTFRQHITCPREAQRRFNSLVTHVIKPRYSEYLGVMERQKSGRIHFHLLIVLDNDIRTGVCFEGLQNRDYSSAPPALRKEWAFWRQTAPKYGFGRTELLPVKSSIEAMAKYLGKYISKHIEVRADQDKGVRLVRYSRGARAGTTRFQFQSKGSQEWRRKLATFAQIIQFHHPDQQVNSISDLTRVLGPRWAHKHRDTILSLP